MTGAGASTKRTEAELPREPCVSHTDATTIVLDASTVRADDWAHSFVYTCACIIAHLLPITVHFIVEATLRGTRATRAF